MKKQTSKTKLAVGLSNADDLSEHMCRDNVNLKTHAYTRKGDKSDCALYFIKKGSIKTLMIKL